MIRFLKLLIIVLISAFTLCGCDAEEPIMLQTAEVTVCGDMYTESCTFTLTHDGYLETTIQSPFGSFSDYKDKSKKLSNSKKLRINELISKVKENGQGVTRVVGCGVMNIVATIDGVTYHGVFNGSEGGPYIGPDLVNLTAELVEISPSRKIKELKQHVRDCIK